MQDSDMIIVNGTQTTNGDENLFVKFYLKDVKNNFLSEKEGHPVYDKKVFVSILSPGSLLSQADRPVKDVDKERFPKQWMNYQNNQHAVITGMPLDQWPALDRNQIEELNAQKFYSVEQIAAASDAQLGNLPNGFNLRTRAKAFIEYAKDTAAAQKLAADNAMCPA